MYQGLTVSASPWFFDGRQNLPDDNVNVPSCHYITGFLAEKYLSCHNCSIQMLVWCMNGNVVVRYVGEKNPCTSAHLVQGKTMNRKIRSRRGPLSKPGNVFGIQRELVFYLKHDSAVCREAAYVCM